MKQSAQKRMEKSTKTHTFKIEDEQIFR